MKIKYILFASIIIILASCSSAYRIGQTPDDVYFSPIPPQVEAYVTSNNQQDEETYGYNNNTYNNHQVSPGVYNSSNFSLGYGSGYNPYGYNSYGYNPYNTFGSSFYNPYSSFYSPYSSFNSGLSFSPFYNYNSFSSPYNNIYSGYYNNLYSPYNNFYAPVYYSSKSAYTGNYSGPRTYNLNAYNNTNRIAQPTIRTSVPTRSFNEPQQTPSNGSGGIIRRVFIPSNNTNNNVNTNRSFNNDNNSSPVRSMNSSGNSGGGASPSGGSGGGAPVRSFRH